MQTQTLSPELSPESRPNPWREVPQSAEVQAHQDQLAPAKLVLDSLIDRQQAVIEPKVAAHNEEMRLRSQIPESRPSVGIKNLNKFSKSTYTNR